MIARPKSLTETEASAVTHRLGYVVEDFDFLDNGDMKMDSI